MVLKKQPSFYLNSGTLIADHGIGDSNEEMFFGGRGAGQRLEAADESKCPLYRMPEELGMGQGFGYCDMDSDRTTCEGNVKSCEKSYALK
jgi:hypothetical protein